MLCAPADAIGASIQSADTRAKRRLIGMDGILELLRCISGYHHSSVTFACGLHRLPRRLQSAGKRGCRTMSTLFAFLHHLCAFTLVSAVAIELTLMRQGLTLASARRLQGTDMGLGIAAGTLVFFGLFRAVYFFDGPGSYFHHPAFLAKFC